MPSQSSHQSGPGLLPYAIGAAIVIWALTFWLVHGLFVFGYLAMHLATTGVFLFAIRRCDRSTQKNTAKQAVRATSSSTSRSAAERVATAQPAA